MKPIDVTVIGELNVDLLLNKLNQLPENGKEVLASQMELCLGSSSAIFATNLSALGTSVQFMGKLGDDLFGQFLLRCLANRNVDTDSILIDPQAATGATVILNHEQDRAMITHQGAMTGFGIQDINWPALFNSRHLHISSIFLQPALKKELVNIFQKAKEAGLTTSLDTQWDPSEQWELPLAQLLPLVDVFLPNEKELCLLTGETSLTKAIALLEPSINILVVKMGEKGSLLVSEQKQRLLSVKKSTSFIDAIGAGDSFNAGFIHQWIRGESLEHCQEFGNACGAFSTTAAGGINAFNNPQKLYADASAIA
ncbi:carbohydrate kinase family protein [Flavihumibacter sp. CACIAM 22H1]|uniref:carbohydrate kinase family protein n=1 Tax=Flavihumibacter sp. CACIAM 22H1 TaxID=1812911 RepID=UPI0007A81F4F|nr:carbohydrate kinase family protein [Flavihumibacter sp. CACIAM 22H1]KYP14397.1 MAG: carbohydrate kinase [Flavihumibacter sp. CACIAM 22H1]